MIRRLIKFMHIVHKKWYAGLSNWLTMWLLATCCNGKPSYQSDFPIYFVYMVHKKWYAGLSNWLTIWLLVTNCNGKPSYQIDFPFCEYGTYEMIRRLIKLICFFMCKWNIRNDTLAYQIDFPFYEYGTYEMIRRLIILICFFYV